MDVGLVLHDTTHDPLAHHDGELGRRADRDDEQAQLAAGIDLAGDEERVETDDRVEPRGDLEIEPDRLAAHEDGRDVEAGGDAQPAGDGRQPRDGDPIAVDHEVAAAADDIEHRDGDPVGVGPEVDEPVLHLLGGEERGHRHPDGEDRLDLVCRDDTDGDRASPEVQVEDGEEGRALVGLECRRGLDEVGLEDEEQSWPRHLDEDDALEVDDVAAFERPEEHAGREGVVAGLQRPPRRIHDAAGSGELVLQPLERRHRSTRVLDPPVVDSDAGKDAEEPEP